MSVQALKQTNVIRIPCVTTPMDLTRVAVLSDTRAMVEAALASFCLSLFFKTKLRKLIFTGRVICMGCAVNFLVANATN